jgi:plastocyanin
MRKTQIMGVLPIITVLVIGACVPKTTPTPTITSTPTPTPTQGAYEVEASEDSSEYFFSPLSITVPVGATVTWTNTGQELHTVTSNTGDLFNQAIAPGESFSFTFTEPGTYHYHCIPHDFQRQLGQVNVK